MTSKKLMARAIAAMAVATVSQSGHAVPFYVSSLEGQTLTSFGAEIANFERPSSQYETFWNFCQPYNCYGYGVANLSPQSRYTGSMSLNEPGSVFAHQANANNFPYVSTKVRSFPLSQTRQTGKAVFEYSSTGASLASVPNNTAVGIVYSEYVQAYSFPSQTGNLVFDVTSVFDASSVPAGYIAKVATIIQANIYASWFSEQGEPAFLDGIVYKNEFDGAGALNVALPLGYSSYPTIGAAPYLQYSISFQQRITIMQAIPEPGTYGLFLAGLALVAVRMRRKVSADSPA
jgi:hypothetical protein